MGLLFCRGNSLARLPAVQETVSRFVLRQDDVHASLPGRNAVPCGPDTVEPTQNAGSSRVKVVGRAFAPCSRKCDVELARLKMAQRRADVRLPSLDTRRERFDIVSTGLEPERIRIEAARTRFEPKRTTIDAGRTRLDVS